MAITITTPPSSTANSYISESDADTYADLSEDSLHFKLASTIARQRALIEATDRLESLHYDGSPASVDNALQWPRSGVRERNGELVEEDVPVRLKRATSLLAIAILKYKYDCEQANTNQSTSLTDDGTQMKSLEVGSLKFSYYEKALETVDAPEPFVIPEHVLIMLQPYAQTNNMKLQRS